MKRSAPLRRKTPLRSTPTRKRSPTKKPLARADRLPSQRCASRGCKTVHVPVVVEPDERYCEKHALARADAACRAFCRSIYPRCVACGRDDRGIQWAHVHTRGMRFVRWDSDNSVGLCDRCHFAYTKSPSRWVKFVELNWPGLYVRVLHRELWADRVGGSVDVGEVIRCYRAGVPWFAPDPPSGAFPAPGTQDA